MLYVLAYNRRSAPLRELKRVEHTTLRFAGSVQPVEMSGVRSTLTIRGATSRFGAIRVRSGLFSDGDVAEGQTGNWVADGLRGARPELVVEVGKR